MESSPASHCPLPQTGPPPLEVLIDEPVVVMEVPVEPEPCVGQSPAHVLVLSPGSQIPLPQQVLQSLGQLQPSSPGSHLPLPQVVGVMHLPQSFAHVMHDSPPSHLPLPQHAP